MDQHLTLDEVEALAFSSLHTAGALDVAARSMARSIRAAERDGIRSHGLMYLPVYIEHLQCGKVLHAARPLVSHPRPGAILVDAAHGFAHPAIDAGWPEFTAAAAENGIAAMTVTRSYNCGVLGHHAEHLALAGLIGLCLTHAPASIAPVGGNIPVIGTNPFALAVPDGAGGAALVIDQSASVVAKSEVILKASRGEPIPQGWALDSDGNPTTSPAAGLKGSMLPSGGYKGFGIGLLVEVLASALSGARSSMQASPFSGNQGGPPGTGQCFIAIAPDAYSDTFPSHIKALIDAIAAQSGARLPGSRRMAARLRSDAQGVLVDAGLMARIASQLKKN